MQPENRDESIEPLDEENKRPKSKRHKTLSKVCETCRLKKSKCDNARPQCSTCRRKGVSCVYREKAQPGLRPGYGKAMDSRLERLEANMEEINSSIRSFLHNFNPLDVSNQDPNHTGGATNVNAVPTAQPRHEAEVQEHDETYGLWQTPPLLPLDGVEMGAAASSGTEPSPLVIADSPVASSGLPATDILNKLVDIFFDQIYPWCPLFYKPTFLEHMFQAGRELLLHGIVVVSFRFWNSPVPTIDERDRYVAHSRQYILVHIVGLCTVVSTQALALLAIDALGQGTGPRAWNTMSMLATAARHLGIATNPALSDAVTESNTPLVRNDDDDTGVFPSIVGAEERTRLFWVICSLDRFSSVAHGVPGGIPTKTIRMFYPKRDLDWNADVEPPLFDGVARIQESKASDSPDLWRQYADLLALADRCNQLLIQPVNLFDVSQYQKWQNNFRELDSALSLWRKTIPAELHLAPSCFDPMWYLMYANFHLIRIRMYTVAAFPSTTSPHVRPSTSARSRCRVVVKELSALARSLELSSIAKLGPLFAFAVWVAARSLVILWATGHESYEDIAEDMETLLSSLRQLSHCWQSAARYSDLIQLVLDTKDSPGGQSHLDIFKDTRRTAYGLEKCLGSLADRKNADIQPTSFDFLDIPFLDAADSNDQWIGHFRLDGNGELF